MNNIMNSLSSLAVELSLLFSTSPEIIMLCFVGIIGLILLLIIVLLFVKIFSAASANKHMEKPHKNKRKSTKREKRSCSQFSESVDTSVFQQQQEQGTELQSNTVHRAEQVSIQTEPKASPVPLMNTSAAQKAAPSGELLCDATPSMAPQPAPPVPLSSSSPAVFNAEQYPEKKTFGLFSKKNPADSSFTDEHLVNIADSISAYRNTIPKKGVKREDVPKKTSKRRTREVLKSKSKKLQIPRTVQDTIPYYAVYPHKAIIETTPGIFTKSYLLQDINYQIAREEEQFNMFMEFGKLLNSFEPTVNFEITTNQKNINMAEFEDQTMIPMKEDNLNDLRIERNEMLKKKIMEGRNSLVKEKYLTVAAPADSLGTAESLFARLDAEIFSNIKKIGSADAAVIPVERRLEILHDIYNIGSEGMFGNNIVRCENEDGHMEYAFAQDKFRFDIMQRMGLTTKDMIGPECFSFKGDYGMVGNTYFRALFVRTLPSFLNDSVLSELTNTECNMLTSLHYQSIDGENAQKMVRNKITNINAGLVDKQKKASKSGYDVRLISPELQNASEETGALLEDINKKNQKLFYVTLVIAHFAESKEQLDSDTKAIQGIGRRLQLDIKKLVQQQEQGLNTALPLAYNQLFVKRVLTTESAAVFMPFVNQELNDRNGGMYYGNNAVSRNLIMLNRRNCKNGNGFIFGTPGSGKSMSAKQEMMTVLLSSDDTVIVIDPEGEYYPMAELMGGEVIRIAAGADAHINPFDIDMGSNSEDDPMAIKSDFIVSLCETAVAGQYGLSATQRSIIDRCVRKAYEPFLATYNRANDTYDKSKLPTLLDFYHLLRRQSGFDAQQLADGLEIYVTGSLNLFAHRTNVEYHKRFVVFDIKDVGATMKSMALLVVLDNIWNRIVAGRKEGRYTWFFIDEIYLLFKTQSSAEFLKNLYKRARKYYGLPTGITQNVSDLLEDDTARTMISNCEYIQMLNQAPLDRAQLAELLNISEAQLAFVTNANPGEGLLFNGRVIVPFVNELPKNTKQYIAMTTKPDEVKAREKLRQEMDSTVQETPVSIEGTSSDDCVKNSHKDDELVPDATLL